MASEKRPTYLPRPTLSLRLAQPEPTIIVEPHGSGFRVNVRPVCSRPDLDRWFAVAGDALDHAELVAGEIGASVVDRTEVLA